MASLCGSQSGGDVFSDAGPETPDSSVKEESDSPEVGPRACLWQDCHEVFSGKGELVEHVNEVHMETKKGSDEYPCLWQVRGEGEGTILGREKESRLFYYEDQRRVIFLKTGKM